MQNVSAHEFQTCDIQIVATLKAFNQHFVRLDWQDGKAFFIFASKMRCEELVQAYWADDLKLSPKTFFNALRETKDRLFQSQRDRR